jgi:sugar lactone lactonase YvrE
VDRVFGLTYIFPVIIRHEASRRLRGIRSVWAAAALLLVSVAATAPAQGPSATDYLRNAVAAYRAKDYAGFLANLERADAIRPNDPRTLYNLACACALTGNGERAVALLDRLAAFGLYYPAGEDGDFAAIRETPAFRAAVGRLEANNTATANSATAFALKDSSLVVEGIAYDPKRATFYLSSVTDRKILAVDERGERVFASEDAGLWSVFGMRVDTERRRLWVTTAALPQMRGYDERDAGRSAIVAFDLETGKVAARFEVPGGGAPHALGDLVVRGNGDVYATDSRTPAIYVVRAKASGLETLVAPGPFVSPQGLDFAGDGRTLFVADYALGLFAVDVESKAVRKLESAPNVAVTGIDGLYARDGSLVAIQNGVRPHRVVRLALDGATMRVTGSRPLEVNAASFDEPTLGVLVGADLYYVASSGWARVDAKGALAEGAKPAPHVVLKLRL